MKKLLTIPALALMFATPALAGDHECSTPVEECLNGMVTKLKSTGFIGVELDQDEATGTLTVSKVIADSPAEKAGIQPGDVLYAINGLRFREENHDAISQVKLPGKEVTCTIKRNGRDKKFKLTLVPMPADLMAKYIGEHMMYHAQKNPKDKVAKK
jgi:C-terminal processing protease CtpA/Prc